MKTDQAASRIEAELQEWKQKEQRFNRMFGFNVSDNRVFLKEKLRHYDTITARFRGTPDPEERLALRILRRERRQIEKQLYPKLWLRLLRRLTVGTVRQRYIALQQAREALRNQQALENAVRKAGFGQIASKLGENLRQGQREFTVPVSCHINEKHRMDFELSFARDPGGRYRFEGYQAALHREGKPEESRRQAFRMDTGTGITSGEAYNLLSGRALQPESSLREGGQGKWLQLDFTDRDAVGNHRVKEFHPAYGYDLKHALEGLPLKENRSQEAAEKLAAALAGGNRQAVTVEKEGREQRYFIEANPQAKTVNIYDANMKKTSLASMMGRKANETVRQTVKALKADLHTGKARKNGISIG